MSNTSFPMIQKLSNERQHLFELGGVQNLSAEQCKRVDEITGRLPGLWEDYRRELAAPDESKANLTKGEKMQRAMVGIWEHGEEGPSRSARGLQSFGPILSEGPLRTAAIPRRLPALPPRKDA